MAAERARSPVIVQSAYSQMDMQFITAGDLTGMIRAIGKRYKDIPYSIHLDHGMTEKECIAALEGGFLSVMYDGSAESYEDNVKAERNCRAASMCGSGSRSCRRRGRKGNACGGFHYRK